MSMVLHRDVSILQAESAELRALIAGLSIELAKVRALVEELRAEQANGPQPQPRLNLQPPQPQRNAQGGRR